LNIDEEIATIDQIFRQLETENADNPNFLLQMDNLEREWISLQSSLTIGLSMMFEQYQLYHHQQQFSSLVLGSRNRLFTEITNLTDEIRKFDSKSSAFLREKEAFGDEPDYLEDLERTTLESFSPDKSPKMIC
jgi:hypothetical protein